ncbi:chromosome partitioning protein [Halostagnicola larsenii XH-48]|uniref:Chromosome partitioning protein n=1 Tax=Halostagnicola larsenii XH-48 TaxID=797299 RepID=W0JKS9_9EURY|nr:P-loop NTPase [Halostagnicola larsenii]AHF99330.1 chromosome partitioning protein [Halostagnicola larsenii XH-48]
MIAIAGAKGGAGKTTTTLALAQALGRAGNRTIAVDADRHLPNLHSLAGVDRDATDNLREANDPITAITQPVPDHSNVNVLPAPIQTGSARMQERLRALTAESADIVVDCPSGAGPDLADPLSIADVALVVSTATDESLTAAAKTVAVARRLETPVAGTVLTMTETIPEEYDQRIDVPVLATIPAADQPLRSSPVRDAFDSLVETLTAEGYLSRTTTAVDRTAERLETGIDALDRTLGGGLAPGSVVAYRAAAASQSELLLYELTSARKTLYLTTERSEDAVSRALESTPATVGTPTDRGAPTVRAVDRETPIEDVTRALADIPDESNLIIDTMDVLESAEKSAYVDFLDELGERMLERGSVAYLHCLKGPTEPENRTRTEHAADVVFDLETDISSAELTHRLSVPKRRCGCQPAESITLDLTDGVSIDTSRDIA